MPVAVQVLAGVAAAIHVFFFYLESIAFTKNPAVAKTFGSGSPEETQVLKGIFLNQGFYNLFLAIGVVAGLLLWWSDGDAASLALTVEHSGKNSLWGEAFVVFGLACMLGAALVLLVSSRGKMLRGALIQGLVPLVALVILAAS